MISRCVWARWWVACSALLALLVSAGAWLAADSAHAEEGCPNEALRQGLSANLPDCRAYELVTPPYKEGALITLRAVSPDGLRAIVQSFGNFGDAGNNQEAEGATYELTRGSSGWTETGVDLPASQFPWDDYRDASSDLSSTLWEARTASQSVYALDFWVRESDGALHDLGPVLPPSETAGPPGLGPPPGLAPASPVEAVYRGASSDLSRVLFTSEEGRWPSDTTKAGTASLYEYSAGHSGPPALVGVDDAGGLIGECGVSLGPESASVGASRSSGAVSADGSVVFFTVRGADSGDSCVLMQPPVDELFARIDESNTIAVSEPSPNAECTGACLGSPPADAEYVGASRDGSKVFFTSTQQLTNGASEDSTLGDSATAKGGTGCAETSGPGGCNLYEYDFDNPLGGNLVLASAGGPEPRVQGVVSVSEDGSHVYFVAKGVLTPAPNEYGAVAVSGSENLYVFERDAQFPAGRVLFIGVLSPEDAEDWNGGESRGEGAVATATPDGQFLVFPSVADLTPDDTSTVSQIFRYDAQTGELVRVSIGESGFNDNGNTDTLPVAIPFDPARVGDGEHLPSAISADGAFVVFQSADGLTPGALNAKATNESGVLAQNVYEYHDGSVSLISDGQDTSTIEDVASVAAEGTTESGGDIFFRTADPLVPQDGDTQVDIYDARIDGGFPAEQSPVACQGEACQGLPSVAPVVGVPGSATFTGSGDLTPAPTVKSAVKPKAKPKQCRKGYVKKKSRCLKKPKSKTKKVEAKRSRQRLEG